jgi:hypothetical protein
MGLLRGIDAREILGMDDRLEAGGGIEEFIGAITQEFSIAR